MELRFRGLIQILKTISDDVTYEELIRNRRLYSVVVNMLDYFCSTESNMHLTYDVVSMNYLSFITLYLGKNGYGSSFAEGRFSVVDEVFQRLDKKSVARLPYMSVQELCNFNLQVKKTLKRLGNTKLLSTINDYPIIDSLYNQLHYSDDQLREIVFNNWIERHYHEMAIDDDQIMLYSPIADDLEKALWAYAEKERIDSLFVPLCSPQPSETKKAISFFFNLLNTVTEKVMNRDNNIRKKNNVQIVESSIFLHLWQAINKRASIWIVPSSVFGRILKLE